MNPQDEQVTWKDLRGWLEFGCWTTLAIAPLLYWFNGSAVSTDQFVVRIALVVVAAIGATCLRAFAWFRAE
jgi:hypothetical protein